MAEAADIELFNPSSIPLTSWNIIFNHVAVEDLKNLSRVSSPFYNMIGDLSDSMDRIALVLDGEMSAEDLKIVLNSTRSYKNIEIKDVESNADRFFDILRKYGSNVRELKLSDCQLTKMEMVKILKFTHLNLEALYIRDLLVCKKKNERKKQYSFKMFLLETLKIDQIDSTLCKELLDFLPDSIVNLQFECGDDGGVRYIGKFIETQKDLKHLKLDLNFDGSLRYLNLINYEKIKFALESMEILTSGSERIQENFQRFLELQAASLKKMKLMNVPIYECISVFENMLHLEKLEVQIHNFPRISTAAYWYLCPSLKTFIFRFSDSRAPLPTPQSIFIKKFCRVPEIVIKMNISSELLGVIAESYNNLKKIVFYRFQDDSFENVIFEQVEELVIGIFLEEDIHMDLVFAAFPNLKTLKIMKSLHVTSDRLFWLLENFKELEHLEIENGSRIRMPFFPSKSHLFENLKSLTISQIRTAYIEGFQNFFEQYPKLHIKKFTKMTESDYDFSDDEYYDSDDFGDEEDNM